MSGERGGGGIVGGRICGGIALDSKITALIEGFISGILCFMKLLSLTAFQHL